MGRLDGRRQSPETTAADGRCGASAVRAASVPSLRQTPTVRRLIRQLLGEQLSGRPDPLERSPLAVSHRVLIASPLEGVWDHVVSPPEDAVADGGAGCVGVLALPRGPETHSRPEFVAIWRRPNGRLRAGISTVVDLQRHARIVSRSADGVAPLTLTTTFEPVEEGCIVTQSLEGETSSFAGPVSARAHRLWLERALLHLKADVESTPLSPGVVEYLGRELAEVDPVHSLASIPICETASIEVAVTPEQLWELLAAPASERLIGPTTEHVLRTPLGDDPSEHVVSVHVREDGRRSAMVSRVEVPRQGHLVERDLTAAFESDVVTTIEPSAVGSLLTESFTGWLPTGAAVPSGGAPVAALVRARLAAIRHLAESGVHAPRDPATGFRPPGDPTAPPPARATAAAAAGLQAPPPRTTLPAGVLLPPPHHVVPAPAYEPDWWEYYGRTLMSLP